jgi:hypothetical protein
VRWAQGMAVKRLRPLDRALLFILVPLWGCWFALYLNNLSRGRVGFLPIVVSVPENPNDYPRVRGFWGEPWGNLKIGDHLVRIGGENPPCAHESLSPRPRAGHKNRRYHL